MRLNKSSRPNFNHGDTVVQTRFALFPTKINDTVIWLERYKILKAYILTTYSVNVEGKATIFGIPKWIVISKKLFT